MSNDTPKKQAAEAKKAREQREMQALRERRSLQLIDVQNAAKAIAGNLRKAWSTAKDCDALLSHSEGFYEEIDKLAKGKALMEVTPLVVEQANCIIRDAKNLVENDVYLDRIKEFVPAGDNPVYPDVLVTIRSVRDSLSRGRRELEARANAVKESLRKAETVIGALRYVLDEDTRDGKDKRYPPKDAVKRYVVGDVIGSCFSRYSNSYEEYFNFDELDRQGLEEYLSMGGQDGAEEVATGDEGTASRALADDDSDGAGRDEATERNGI